MAALFRFPRWLWQVIGVIVLLTPLNLYAARFGATYVLSQIGQPLRAKIEVLDVQADELGWLTLQSAPENAYENSSMRFSSAAQEIKATVERTPNGQVVAWLTTASPVKEEFIDLLLTLSWSTGRMTEALTLLIPRYEVAGMEENVVPLANAPEETAVPFIDDSALTSIAPSAPITSPAASAAASAAAKAAVAQKPLMPTLQTEKKPQNSNPQRAYKVRRGDTLAKVAQQMRNSQGELATVTLDQLLWAIYQGNPQAFNGENINRLKAGVVLEAPSSEQANALAPDEARRQIVAQGHEFERYRSVLAEAAVPSKEGADVRSSSGDVSAAVEEVAPEQTADQLRLSRSETQQHEESAIASQNALREAQERVAQLEKHVSDLRQLADLKGGHGSAKVEQPGVSLVTVEKPAGPLEKVVEKLQSLFSHNPAAPLGMLLSILVLGTVLLRRRAKAKPLFPEYREQDVPAAAKKIFADLNLDLEPQIHAKVEPTAVVNTNGVAPPTNTLMSEGMQIRLKLAQAYVDLGDKSGACKLLEEVLEHGTPPQRKQAQQLLATLT